MGTMRAGRMTLPERRGRRVALTTNGEVLVSDLLTASAHRSNGTSRPVAVLGAGPAG